MKVTKEAREAVLAHIDAQGYATMDEVEKILDAHGCIPSAEELREASLRQYVQRLVREAKKREL